MACRLALIRGSSTPIVCRANVCRALDIEIGETVARDGFVFADCWLRDPTVEGKRSFAPGV